MKPHFAKLTSITFWLIIAYVFLVQNVSAKRIDEAEARAIAMSFKPMQNVYGIDGNRGKKLLKQVEGATGNPALYVFSSEGSNDFIIVSGDDETAGPVLGYGNYMSEGEELPPAFSSWIDELANQIDLVSVAANSDSQNSSSVRYLDKTTPESTSTGHEILPLLGNMAWNQSAPFNGLCPEKSGVRCVTGCVATSICQIMRYWEYPAQGTGSWSYQWNGETLSRDFSSSTYSWEEMPYRYTSSSTETEKEAVARLMSDVGIAVSMDYGTSESAASTQATIYALYNNFGYDASMQLRERSFYGIDLWEDVIRRELDEGRPVIYAGQSSYGGHQFVCDGYDSDGYFHFNWGWSGMCDGYFLTSALVPEGIGTGGYSKGYNYNQTIITGIQPSKGRSADSSFTCFGHSLGSSDAVNYALVVNGYSFIAGEVEIDLGYTASTDPITSVDNQAIHKTATLSVNPTIPARGSGLIYSMVISNGTNTFDPVKAFSLSDGDYYITPIYKPSKSDTWEVLPCGTRGNIKLNVAGGIPTVVPFGQAAIDILSLDIPHEMKIGRTTKINCELRAENREFDGPVSFIINNSSGDTIATAGTQLLQLAADESQELVLEINVPVGTSPGKYESHLLISGNAVGNAVNVNVVSSQIKLDSTSFPDSNLLNAIKGFDKDNDGILSDIELSNATILEAQSMEIYDATGLDNLYALKQLYLDNNSLSSLNLVGLDNLELLSVNRNSLTEIDLSQNKELFYIRCTENELQSIDVAELTNLQSLDISDNPIVAIDLSLNDALNTFVSDSKASVNVGSDRSVDLASYPELDADKIENLQGADLSGGKLTFKEPTATYNYNTGNTMFPTMPVTLIAKNSSGINLTETDCETFDVVGLNIIFSDDSHPHLVSDPVGRVIAQGHLKEVTLPNPGLYIISGEHSTTKIIAR